MLTKEITDLIQEEIEKLRNLRGTPGAVEQQTVVNNLVEKYL